jgi:glycosyltransferase involved in cell wall biosynthesis
MQPKITIIVPLYNKVAEVGRALKSILTQTISEYELLIIDGGSTDGSLNVVEPYLQDSRIRLLHQKSKGLPAGRNEAILEAKGDLIAFLDADDEWHPDFLETIIRLYTTYPGAGIYATAYERCVIDFCKDNIVRGLPPERPWEGYIPSYFRMYVEAGYPPFCPCSVALDRHVFDKVGYFNPNTRVGEDVEMWVKVAFNCDIVFTTNICARYHMVSSNKMINDFKTLNMHPAVTYLLSLPDEQLQSHENHVDIIDFIEYLKLVTVYFNIGAGDCKSARKILCESHTKNFLVRSIGLTILAYFPVSFGKAFIHQYIKLPLIEYKLRNIFKSGESIK